MRYLIDGYNLMYAVGKGQPGDKSRARFDAARKSFLDWLVQSRAVKANPGTLRIVFDAQNSKCDLGSSLHKGLLVTFSFNQTADDLIEALLSVESKPKDLRVVSNDTRLQDFAKRRGSTPMTCGEFLDWLMSDGRPASLDDSPKPDDKPKPNWIGEQEFLLKAFGGEQ